MVVILLVYVDSYFFVAATSVLQIGVGLTANGAACEYHPPAMESNCAGPRRSCAYSSIVPRKYCTRVIVLIQIVIYLFLIERVHIVRGGTKTRKQDKLYWFNLIGLIPYCAIVILAIIFRYNSLGPDGQCFVGLRRESSFPLLIYDLIINVPLDAYSAYDRSTSPVNSSCRCWDYTRTKLSRILAFVKLQGAL